MVQFKLKIQEVEVGIESVYFSRKIQKMKKMCGQHLKKGKVNKPKLCENEQDLIKESLFPSKNHERIFGTDIVILTQVWLLTNMFGKSQTCV